MPWTARLRHCLAARPLHPNTNSSSKHKDTHTHAHTDDKRTNNIEFLLRVCCCHLNTWCLVSRSCVLNSKSLKTSLVLGIILINCCFSRWILHMYYWCNHCSISSWTWHYSTLHISQIKFLYFHLYAHLIFDTLMYNAFILDTWPATIYLVFSNSIYIFIFIYIERNIYLDKY